ncbi:hypothetical protein NKG05_01000 [Oerskovia sp. M15]
MPQGTGGGGGLGVYVANARYSALGEPLLYDLGNSYSELLSYTYEEGTRRLANTSLVRELMTGTALNLTYTRDLAGTSPRSRMPRPANQSTPSASPTTVSRA